MSDTVYSGDLAVDRCHLRIYMHVRNVALRYNFRHPRTHTTSLVRGSETQAWSQDYYVLLQNSCVRTCLGLTT